MQIRLNKSTMVAFIGIFIYKLLLDLVYIFYIQNNIYYWGFDLDINYLKCVESYILLIIVYFFIPKGSSKVSSYIMQFQYLTIFIPMISLYSLENQSRLYIYEVVSIFIFINIFLKQNVHLRLKTLNVNKRSLMFFIYISIAITILGLLKSGLIPNLKSFDFAQIYSIRANIKLEGLIAYMIGIITRIINPFLICVSYKEKEYKKTIYTIIIQLLIYSMYPQKSILFSLGLVFLMIFIINKNNFFIKFIWLLNLMIIISVLVYIMFENDMFISLFIRRVLFVPANIQFDYYDFFSNNQYLYMSNNTIGNIMNIQYPYHMPIENLIASIYYNQPNMRANTCYIAESYAQLGYLGMMIYSLIFVIINNILDWISVKIDKVIVLPTIVFSIYALNDTSLLTTLLTHGLFPGIIIIYIYMGISNKKSIENKFIY